MRIKIILVSLVSILFIGFAGNLTSSALPSADSDTLTFIHLTDVHFCNLTGYHHAFVQKRQHFGNAVATFPELLKNVPALGNDKVNWRVIKITKDKVLISRPGSTETEYTVQLN